MEPYEIESHLSRIETHSTEVLRANRGGPDVAPDRLEEELIEPRLVEYCRPALERRAH